MNAPLSTPQRHALADPALPGIDAGLVFLLACAAGLSVAAIYYNQPMLGMLAAQFSASPAEIGRVPTFTQVGYALGIFFLAPLGDRYDRRTIILAKILALTLALLGTAASQALWQLIGCSIALGLSASLAQDCVPAAATLAPEQRRGQVVGTVMSGLLFGILLSRVASGLIAQWLGWRAVFVLAAAFVAVLGVVAQRRLPRVPPTTTLPYATLLGSLVTLWRRFPELRRAALAQGALSLAFSGFWSTLALMLHQSPFNYGSAVAGAFGLAGAVGALAAPLAGRIADRRGPQPVTRLGAVLVLLSFLGMAWLPGSLAMLIAGVLLFDLGVQAALIAHQSIIYRQDPAARSRLNAILIGAMFIGMALGSSLASLMLAQAGWRGVCLLAAGAAALALAIRLLPARDAG
ncbi:MFS transporter [Niveibacterium sp. SC-1]|uniref:MFS transporter n=1 Tax=Niveibacterium sp. SC-1 TaxID=3135646 RepID=UPI00311E2967